MFPDIPEKKQQLYSDKTTFLCWLLLLVSEPVWADMNLIDAVLLSQLPDMIIILREILLMPNKALKLIPLLLESKKGLRKPNNVLIQIWHTWRETPNILKS